MQRPERERKEPTEFNVIVKAKDLVKHTFTITNSTERYPKKYRFTLVNRIQDKAVDIYECVLEANELGVSRCTPNVFQALVLSRFFHAVVMYFTSSASFDQYSQLLIEIKPISCESSMKNRSSLQ